ncbi:hypothetical protein [Streptomyces europaeiscabiei]|uniref:hypothetical protein n=1 Tax=Streptomyces europaeiscabiei TaxID=146819 RepID=UPI0038F77DC0
MSVWDEEPDSLRMFYDLAVAEALRHDDIQAYLSLNRAEINASALRGIMREDAVADAVLDGEVRYEQLWHLGRRLDRSPTEIAYVVSLLLDDLRAVPDFDEQWSLAPRGLVALFNEEHAPGTELSRATLLHARLALE